MYCALSSWRISIDPYVLSVSPEIIFGYLHASSCTNASISISSVFNSTDSHDYRLRMWVADDYVFTGTSQTFKVRVNVYGAAAAQ